MLTEMDENKALEEQFRQEYQQKLPRAARGGAEQDGDALLSESQHQYKQHLEDDDKDKAEEEEEEDVSITRGEDDAPPETSPLLPLATTITVATTSSSGHWSLGALGVPSGCIRAVLLLLVAVTTGLLVTSRLVRPSDELAPAISSSSPQGNDGLFPEHDALSAAAAVSLSPFVPPPPSPPRCDFTFERVNEDCPRFIYMGRHPIVGLGDRIFMYVMLLTLAVDIGAVPIVDPAVFESGGQHGSYAWAPSFLQLPTHPANYTEEVMSKYNLHRRSFEDANYDRVIAKYSRKKPGTCNALFDDERLLYTCIEGNTCYFANEPHAYERMRRIARCHFTHSSSSSTDVPALRYHRHAYNVAIHLRVGDIALMQGERHFFTGLRRTIHHLVGSSSSDGGGDDVRVYFFFDGGGSTPGVGDEEQNGGSPPAGYEFLSDLFPSDSGHESEVEVDDGGSSTSAATSGDGSGGVDGTDSGDSNITGDAGSGLGGDGNTVGDVMRMRAYYIGTADVHDTLLHLMNADMLVGTGSSFPYVAMLFSWKPVVLLARPKEGDFYGVYRQEEGVLLDGDGRVAAPSNSEAEALVQMKRYHFFGQTVPHGLLQHLDNEDDNASPPP